MKHHAQRIGCSVCDYPEHYLALLAREACYKQGETVAGNQIVNDKTLIGKNSEGKLLFGYARLPGVNYSPYVVKR
jgi:hypothetical protein